MVLASHVVLATRIMFLVSGGIRAFSEQQQCPMWYAMREVLKASSFHSGHVHLVSIPSAHPFKPRWCPEAEWAEGSR